MKKKILSLITLCAVSVSCFITANAAEWVIKNYDTMENGIECGSSFDPDKMIFTLEVSANARSNDTAYWRTLGYHVSWMPDVENKTVDHSTDIIVPVRWSEYNADGSYDDSRNFMGGGDENHSNENLGEDDGSNIDNTITQDKQHNPPYYYIEFERTYGSTRYTKSTIQISMTYLMKLASVQNPAMAAHLQEMADALAADPESDASEFEGGLWFNSIVTWYQDDNDETTASDWWGRLVNSGGTANWWTNSFTEDGFVVTYKEINGEYGGSYTTKPKTNDAISITKGGHTKTMRKTMVHTYYNMPIIISHQKEYVEDEIAKRTNMSEIYTIMYESDYQIGKMEPDYYTYNYVTDGKFVAGGTAADGTMNAVPSSENLTNGYEADEFYGIANINRRYLENSWTFRADYHHEYEVTEQSDEDENGDGVVDEHDTVTYTETDEGEVSYTIKRNAAYWYIFNANFMVLDHVQTESDVFPYSNTASGRATASDHEWTYTSDCNDGVGNDTTITCLVNGVNMNGISFKDSIEAFIPLDSYHVNWHTRFISKLENKTAVNEYGSTIDAGYADAYTILKKWAESQVPQNEIQSRNDLLRVQLKDGSTSTYMNNEWYLSDDCATDKNAATSFYEMQDTDTVNSYGSEREEATGKIPAATANGEYYTSITAYYMQQVTKSDDNVCNKFGKDPEDTTPVYADLSYDSAQLRRMPVRILDENDKYGNSFTNSEPVRVHTPTVSQFHLTDKNGDTLDPDDTHQLVRYPLKLGDTTFQSPVNKNVDGQLLLDGIYNIVFDPVQHLEHIGYAASEITESMYDKYCAFKQVCFPFTVQVNGVVYEPTSEHIENGIPYTEWIYINHYTQEYYIPTWAEEGNSHVILVRVAPINVVDANGVNHINDEEWLKNQTFEGRPLYEYVSIYSNTVQLSGIIYDFQAVGVSNSDEFIGKNPQTGKSWGFSISSQELALSPLLQEKKSGLLNRLGGTSVRYTYNGTLTNNWEEMNTLPFSNGRSSYYDGFGYLRKGDYFAFSVKTIANLADAGDMLYIVPTFRYISMDGTEIDDVDVYYKDTYMEEGTDKLKTAIIQNGTELDKKTRRAVSLWDNMFHGAFYSKTWPFNRTLYQDDVEFSADYDGWEKSDETYLQDRQTDKECYSLSNIILNSNLRLLTGNLEQLELNEYNENPNLTNMTTGWVEEKIDTENNKVTAISHIYDLTEEREPEMWDEFRESMQTWYGEYWIPASLTVTKDVFEADADGDGVKESYDSIHDYIQVKGYMDWQEDFIFKEGYLVVNFQIYTFNDGESHLVYAGTNGGDNMWKIQGQPTTTKVGDKNFDEEIEVPVRPGDVAIVDISTSWRDNWMVGSNRIN